MTDDEGNEEHSEGDKTLVDDSVSLVSLESEMKSAYLDYAMSVIVSRAIPDLRDGLKPVHRRVLYSMNETNNTFDRPYRKSARPVGDVMGKYHPHGDQAIYDALVRMAQDFSMSLPLLDGQGNFGSIDGDSAAAMRYTEVRMAKPSSALLDDIEKGTVDFQDNYDGKDVEPKILPARFPNLLVNGAGGIAVGMATNIPPHNIGEVIDATLAVIEDPKIEIEELMKLLPAPDFPTGGIILGQSGSRQAYLTGKGSIIIRAKYTVEQQKKDRFSIVVTEIPYQVNKSSLVEKIAELAREKKIEGISHVQDESDRLGVRVVIDLKRDATIEVVLNQLYRFSQMQTSFGFNLLALDKGKPTLLDLKTFLNKFIEFREEVVAKRTIFELEKARERSHLLCGLAVAVSNVDKVITIIRNSENPSIAKEALMTTKWKVGELRQYLELIDDPLYKVKEDGTYWLSEQQAKAILELRLQRLTALGASEIGAELEELSDKIRLCLDILRSREKIRAIISDELSEVKKSYTIPRRSEIQEFEGDFEDEDLIEKEEMVVTVTREGYIKRTALSEYREQKRGGKGTQGMNTKETDVVTNLFVTNTHTPLLFFSSDGFVYKLKTWRLPQSGRNSKGKAIVNLLPINQLARITTILPVEAEEETWEDLQIFFATSTGNVRKNALSDFINVKANGKIAMKLPENTTLIGAQICKNDNDVLLTTAKGKAIRFNTEDVRFFKGRDSVGVKGISLKKNDAVISMAILKHIEVSTEERLAYFKMRRAITGEDSGVESDETSTLVLSQERYVELGALEEWILTITSQGFGKRSSAHEYRRSGRGGQGITSANLERRQDSIIASFTVEDDDQIMLVTSAGQSIRCSVSEISRQSRSASGVRVFDTKGDENVVSVAWIADTTEDSD